MEKILIIDGRQVKFKSTGAYLLRYKAQFKRDALKDLMLLEATFDKETNDVKNIESLDLEVIFNLIWVLAKTADPSIPPPIDWLDTFSEFPIVEILPDVFDMLQASISSSAKKK